MMTMRLVSKERGDACDCSDDSGEGKDEGVGDNGGSRVSLELMVEQRLRDQGKQQVQRGEGANMCSAVTQIWGGRGQAWRPTLS